MRPRTIKTSHHPLHVLLHLPRPSFLPSHSRKALTPVLVKISLSLSSTEEAGWPCRSSAELRRCPHRHAYRDVKTCAEVEDDLVEVQQRHRIAANVSWHASLLRFGRLLGLLVHATTLTEEKANRAGYETLLDGSGWRRVSTPHWHSDLAVGWKLVRSARIR